MSVANEARCLTTLGMTALISFCLSPSYSLLLEMSLLESLPEDDEDFVVSLLIVSFLNGLLIES